jgi:hypothetical protein
MPIGDDALAAGYPLVPETGEDGRLRWGAREINRTRDFVALLPRGELDFVSIGAHTASFIAANNTTYDIPGLSVASSLQVGRKYKITACMGIGTNSSSDGGNRLLGIISDGSNNALKLASGYTYVDHAGWGRPADVFAHYTALATGTFTFKCRVYRSTGIGTQYVTIGSYIHVEDIGLG